MLVFHSPDIVNGSFELAIARRSPGTYLVILARAYGMAATRVYTVLNTSTPPSTVPPLSSSGHPLIWLDADLDRRPPHLGPPDGVLAALRAADSEVIRPTGRTQRMNAKLGGERDAHEVELVLEEDQLARCCWYCDAFELDTDFRDNRRFLLCSGEGYESTYMCPQVGHPSTFTCQSNSYPIPVRPEVRVLQSRLRLLALFLMSVLFWGWPYSILRLHMLCCIMILYTTSGNVC